VTQAWVDAGIILGACVAAGGAGWWAHATVDDWRVRKMCARINERVSERI
jgi:hypothetical protein